MHIKVLATTFALLVATIGAAAADQPGSQPDPFSQVLVHPEVVMSHQQELGLTDAEKHSIQADVQEAQSRFTQLQWQLSATVERLTQILGQAHVDENAALAQLDREQGLEHDIKRTQLTLMIRVKNVLTPDQQAKAFALQRSGT